MAGIGAGYDLSVSTFSPDGRVFQVEYATKAVDSSPTAAAILCTDGIVFAADSFACGLPQTVESDSGESLGGKSLQACAAPRLFAIEDGIGAAVAGMLPDARAIVKRAIYECRSFVESYQSRPKVRILAERIALYVHAYTLYWHVRPFGASVLLAGFDQAAPELYCIEPSGACYQYQGMAIGKGKHLAKTEIEKLNLSNLTCKEALVEICYAIMQGRDDENKTNDVQIAWICAESGNVFQQVPQDVAQEAKGKAEERMNQESEK